MRCLVVLAFLAHVANASPMTVTGVVTDAKSRWTSDGSRIVTEATVHTADGDVVVSQLGGTVDGLTMRTFPGPRILEPGLGVAIAAHRDTDLSARDYIVVDRVKVTSDIASFVRTGPTKAGHYLFWESGCVFLTIDQAGTKEIPNDQEFPVIDASIATWQDATASCSYLQLINEGRKAVEVGKDGVNVIKFRDDSWCRPKIKDDPPRCYDENAAGITTATYVDDGGSDRDGAIVDADIELNGKNFALSIDGMTLGASTCKADLQNTLTHELGHLQGLEHTCLAFGDDPRVDDQGNPVPSCDATNDPKIREATMFNYQTCGETSKSTLTQDDIDGICAIYPKAADPGTCEHVSLTASGCQGCGAGGEPPLAMAAIVGALLGRRRRRERQAA